MTAVLEPALLNKTSSWLKEHAEKLQTYAQENQEEKGEDAAIRKKIRTALNCCRANEDNLQSLRETLVELARHQVVAPDAATALRQFQEAMVDLARVVIHFRLKKFVGLDHLPMPPYDLWLPFKGGRGIVSTDDQ